VIHFTTVLIISFVSCFIIRSSDFAVTSKVGVYIRGQESYSRVEKKDQGTLVMNESTSIFLSNNTITFNKLATMFNNTI
jgi:type IV secretory pathway component VirB8